MGALGAIFDPAGFFPASEPALDAGFLAGAFAPVADFGAPFEVALGFGFSSGSSSSSKYIVSGIFGIADRATHAFFLRALFMF